MDYISRVDEPQSCEYVIVVKTAKICSIPQLKPPQTKKPKPIDCSPVLNELEFKKYEEYKIGKITPLNLVLSSSYFILLQTISIYIVNLRIPKDRPSLVLISMLWLLTVVMP